MAAVSRVACIHLSCDVPSRDDIPRLYSERIQLSDPRTWRQKALWSAALPLGFAALAAIAFIVAGAARSHRLAPPDITGALFLVLGLAAVSVYHLHYLADSVVVEGDMFRVRKGPFRFRVPVALIVGVTRGTDDLLGRTICLTVSEDAPRLGTTIEFLPVGFDSMLTSELVERVEYIRRFAPFAAPSPPETAGRNKRKPAVSPVKPAWLRPLQILIALFALPLIADEIFGTNFLRGYSRPLMAVVVIATKTLLLRFPPPDRGLDQEALDQQADHKIRRQRGML